MRIAYQFTCTVYNWNRSELEYMCACTCVTYVDRDKLQVTASCAVFSFAHLH